MSTEIKPQKPWQLSTRELAYPFFILATSALASFLTVLGTPMNGKLAFAFLFFIFSTVSMYVYKFRILGKQAAIDSIASSIALTGALIVFAPVVSILVTTIIKGLPGLHLSLFTDTMFSASYLDPIDKGGLLHAIVGTLYLIILSIIISVPMGILSALYLTEIKGPGSKFIQFTVQAMSGVPSIVAGLFILSSLIYPVTKELSGLMGSLALTILMIPTIARTSEEMLLLISNELREAGVALGGTQWRTVAGVVLPAARSGLVTAIILGIARIIGETAPILLVSGGGDAVNLNPAEGAMGSLPYYIWKAFLTGGTPEAFARAWAGMLVLLAFIFILFGLARYLSGRKVA